MVGVWEVNHPHHDLHLHPIRLNLCCYFEKIFGVVWKGKNVFINNNRVRIGHIDKVINKKCKWSLDDVANFQEACKVSDYLDNPNLYQQIWNM